MTRNELRRNYGHADDGDLLRWARNGDQHAFAELAKQNSRVVRSVCLRIVGDEQLAEDAVQNTLLAAWRNIAKFEGRARFSTWLCQIAHNASLALVKRKVPEPVDRLPQRAERQHRPGPAETVADVHSVRWALGKLPPDFRAALVLREYGDLSYQEIAVAQNIQIDTVKSRIARARQGLVALLGESFT